MPTHSPIRRAGFIGVAIVVAICGSLGNALVSVNIGTLPGSLGLDPAEATWLTSIYVAFSASANLLLVRARAQFGIPNTTLTLLGIYGTLALVQIVIPCIPSAILVRAASGIAATALTTMTTYNLLQVFPSRVRPLALCIGVSLPQFATPLARFFPVDLLALSQWQGLHLIEFALVLAAIVALTAHPIPPSDKVKSFQPLDFVTFAFALPGMILFCGALGAARYLWWTDTPWLGWAFAVSIPLIATSVLIEVNRTRPLLQVDWLTSAEILRFAGVALLVRFALAEQSYGAIGLLTTGGLNNDQLHILFGLVILAMVAGVVVACLTLAEPRIGFQVMIAALIIAYGAWLDTSATVLTRPAQLYVSQALIGFGTTLFYGPALLFGMIRVLRLGPNYLVSLLVVFSTTQNVGGLLGSTLLSTFQVIRARAHAAALSENLVASNPQIAARIAAQGPAALYAALQRQAAVLAFIDVFQIVTALAIGTALFVFFFALRNRYQLRRQAKVVA